MTKKIILNNSSMEKRNIILGISALYHDSSAALVIDGEIIGAVQEERFSRVKGDSSLPINSINYLLGKYDIKPNEITAIAYYENPNIKLERILTTLSLGRVKSYFLFINNIMNWFPNKYFIASRLKKILGVSIPTYYLHHHLSHAASAFYPSPFKRAAYLTIDGVGEWESLTWGVGEDKILTKKESIKYPNSLGLLYSAFTYYCGFKINSGEYKLMGLAPYGEAKYVDMIKREIINIHDDGSFELNPKYFEYFEKNKTIGYEFEKLFGRKIRGKKKLEEFHANIAASIQEVIAEVILKIAKRVREESEEEYLVLAGGVALNVTAMGALERSGLFKKIWIQPASGDAGGSLGSALYLAYNYFNQPRSILIEDSMKLSSLGARGDDFTYDAKTTIESYQAVTREVGNIETYIAQELSDGKIVAIYEGAGEFGPRALGHRSILADAREPEMQRKLNEKTKFRESFRPFAPIALEADFHKFYDSRGETSPYMLKSYFLREEYQDERELIEGNNFAELLAKRRGPFSAVTHVDYSSRVQSVDEDSQEFITRVLKSYKALTGYGLLINTSFNLKNEPMVNSPIDALECFIKSEIDIIYLDGFILLKNENIHLKSKIKRFHEDD